MNKLRKLMYSKAGYIIKSSALPVLLIVCFIGAIICLHHYFVDEPQKKVETIQQLIEDKEYHQAADMLYDFSYKGYNLNNEELIKICKKDKELKLYPLEIGDKVKFGRYKQKGKNAKRESISWYVIDKRNGMLLLQSVNILEYMPLNKESAEWREYADFEESTLYEWLNNDFYEKSFNDKEKNVIVDDDGTKATILESDARYDFENKDGERIEDSRAKATKYAKSKGITVDSDGLSSVWTSSYKGTAWSYTAWVMNEEKNVAFGESLEVKEKCGVRPVIWVKVAPITDKTAEEGEKK